MNFRLSGQGAALAGLVVLLSASPTALAQSASWVQQTPATHPQALIDPGMAYDSVHQRVVLFSGTTSNGTAATTPNDTWLWDGKQETWTLATPAHKPAGRVSCGIAWDEARQQVVMFGGGVGNSTFGDTWVWDGADWTQKSPATSPPGRQGFSMAYDEVRQQIVLFGGLGSNGKALSDTWTWDGNTWTQQVPATSPSARLYPQMAFDSVRQQTVLFGGQSFVSGSLGDTWIWDGANWTQQAPAVQPPPLRFHAMVYDSALQQTVIFGGIDALGPTAATWLWDGITWSQFTGSTPSARYDVGMAYDAGNQQAVIFGGDTGVLPRAAETWTFGGAKPTVNITVPAGVQFTFNSQTYTGSQAIEVAAGSYTLSTVSPQALGTGTQAVFASWSDAGAQSHLVTVGASGLSITGLFTTQYLLSTSASPASGGTVTQTGPASNGPYYNAGTLVSVFETPAGSYAFAGWTGACTGTGACFVTMTAPAAVTGTFQIPVYLVTINVPAGIGYSIGGFPLTGPTSISLPAGNYGLSTTATQATGSGTQAVFQSWSDGGALSHTLTVASAPLTVTGTFKTQYFLTTNVSPANEGAVNPASGFYDAGSPVSPAAGANTGFEFEYWSGGGCTGSNAFCFLAMNAPTTLTANFSTPFQWVPMFPATSPDYDSEWNGGAIVYDEARQQAVLFEGIEAKTWIQDGVTWTQKFPAHSPSSRNSYAAAYDALHSQVVLFGGRLEAGAGAESAETWTWDGSDWTLRSPPVSPPGRDEHAMVYDARNQKVMLFGGNQFTGLGTTTPLGDTWTWDGANWTQQDPAPAPVARFRSGVAWDAARQEVVLYGGIGLPEGGTELHDTWTWNGSSWTARTPALAPNSSLGTMAYDPLNQQVVNSSAEDTQTWLWDGNTWASRASYASPLGGTLAYDEARQQIISFAPLSATWIYTNVAHPRYLLTVSAAPAAGGSVGSSAAGQTGPSYYSGTPVQLFASVAPGYSFVGWSGCAGTLPVCTVTMNADTNVVATFSNGPVNVTVQVPAGIQFTLNGATYTGTQIIPLAPGNYPIAIGSPQSAGSGTQAVFTSWSDGGAQSHQITVAGAMSITAAFKTQFTLTASASPITGGIAFSTGGPWYDLGTNVPVNQIPTQGYTFSNWSGACTGSGACSVTMNSPASVTANYNAPKFNLTISVPPGVQYSLFGFPLTGTQTLLLPVGNYPITVNPLQATGTGTQLAFVAWSDGGTATHTIALGAANLTVTGSFKTQYLLTTSVSPAAEGAVVPGSGYYDAGSVVAVIASASPGYQLQYWSGSCSGLTCFLSMNAPANVTANFGVPRQWVQWLPTSSPPSLTAPGMVYDAARQQSILFGTADLATGSTWVFDGNNWTQKHPAQSPPGLTNFGMAYDEAHSQAVVYGGVLLSGIQSATWIWDGTTWTDKSQAVQPGQRTETAMAYDAARGQTVLFGGGFGGVGAFNDTWVWDGATWTQKFPNHSPASRGGHTMAYDAAHQVVVLFGGNDGDANFFHDTWLWNGSDWVQQAPLTSPPARFEAGMAYDAGQQQTILYGGTGAFDPAPTDTWAWDGSNWIEKQLSPNPGPRESYAMTYDPVHQELILFGGLSLPGDGGLTDTWVSVSPSVNLVLQAPSAMNDGQGNYLVTVSLKNQGNVPLTHLLLSSAKLGSVGAAAFNSASIAVLEPGATGSFTARFPIASIAGKTTSVTFQGTFSAATAVNATWTANARQLILP